MTKAQASNLLVASTKHKAVLTSYYQHLVGNIDYTTFILMYKAIFVEQDSQYHDVNQDLIDRQTLPLEDANSVLSIISDFDEIFTMAMGGEDWTKDSSDYATSLYNLQILPLKKACLNINK